MKADYLIVGFGLAGISLSYQLESIGKKVIVIDSQHYTKASIVAAGLYNPVILNRFTLAWNAEEQINYAKHFYDDLSAYLNIATKEKIPVYRKFNNIEEQNNWFTSIDKPKLATYLSPYLKDSPSKHIESKHQFGEVMHTGRLLIKPIVDTYKNKLENKNCFITEEFDHDSLSIATESITYKNITANKIVFCEGHKLKNNPLFSKTHLVGNKGSYLIIKSPELKLKVALKSYYFLIPLGEDNYKFGATYGIHFKEDNYLEKTKEELVRRLETLTKAPYQIIDHITGIRPTVTDRRPLIGQHSTHKPVYLLNGLGTRGVMLAPTASKHLVGLMEQNTPLPKDMNIERFQKKN